MFGGDTSLESVEDAQGRIGQIYANIKDPTYKELIPELYNNETLNYELNTEDPITKSLQMQSLARMAGLAESGQSDVDQAGYAKARGLGSQMAKAGTAAAIQDAQNRGVGGSGMEFAMREMANQGGAQRAQEAALQQASDSARQRALYQQAYGAQLGGQRDQDYRAGAANTDIVNRFNQANTVNRNNNANDNVDKREAAFKYNEGLKDKNYGNQLGRADRLAGHETRNAEISAAQAEADRKRRSAMMGAVGTGVGAAVGGPVGAGIGGSIGSAMG